jgi:hypothetical protein
MVEIRKARCNHDAALTRKTEKTRGSVTQGEAQDSEHKDRYSKAGWARVKARYPLSSPSGKVGDG